MRCVLRSTRWRRPRSEKTRYDVAVRFGINSKPLDARGGEGFDVAEDRLERPALNLSHFLLLRALHLLAFCLSQSLVQLEDGDATVQRE